MIHPVQFGPFAGAVPLDVFDRVLGPQFVLFTIVPLGVLLGSAARSLYDIQELEEYKLLLLVAILVLMSNHQLLEAWSVFAGGDPVGGASEAIETGANLLSAVGVYYGVGVVERQREIAEDLEESEQRYRTLTERSPLAILVNRGEEIRYANPAAAELLGVEDSDELVGASLSDRVHPEDREEFWDHHGTIVEEDEVHTEEYRFVTADGDTRTVVVAGGCARFGGEPASYLLLRDVTRERKFEEGLQRATAQFETTLESSNDAIFQIDPDRDEILRANERAAELLGYDRETLLGMSPREIHPHEVDRFREFVDTVQERERLLTDELSCKTKRGAEVPVEISASLVTVDGRETILVAARDISDRKRREHQIEVLQRILRHNLRNDLSIVLGHAELIADEVTEASLRESAEAIVEKTSSLVSISKSTHRLQEILSSRTDGGTVDLPSLVDDVVEAARESYPEATIEVDAPETLPVVHVTGLDWALEELVENAVEHNEGAQPRVEVSVSLRPTEGGDGRGVVVVSVADDGPGIPEGELAALRIDVEQTDVSHGSGFGLHVVGQVVTSIGGTVTVTDRNGDGSEVRMELPIKASQ